MCLCTSIYAPYYVWFKEHGFILVPSSLFQSGFDISFCAVCRFSRWFAVFSFHRLSNALSFAGWFCSFRGFGV